MDLFGVDPLVWASVITAGVALFGYGVNGWLQKLLDQRRQIFAKKVEVYTEFADALNGISEQLYALREVRMISWPFQSDKDINDAALVNRRMMAQAEIQEQVFGGSSVRPLRDAHEALVKGEGQKMTTDQLVYSIKRSVDDLDDLHVNWLGHHVHRCMAAELKLGLYTSDQLVFRLGVGLNRYLREEQNWLMSKMILGTSASINEQERTDHSDQFFARANASIAAMREDLARNALPRKMLRDWPRIEASLEIMTPPEAPPPRP